MNRLLALLALSAGIVAAGSCGEAIRPEEKPTPQPGELRVLFSGHDSLADSGIVFVIIAPTPVSPSAAAGMQLYHRAVDDSTTRLAVIGPLTSGKTLLTFAVPDVGAANAYRIMLEAVAGANGEPRNLPGPYSLSIAP